MLHINLSENCWNIFAALTAVCAKKKKQKKTTTDGLINVAVVLMLGIIDLPFEL